MEEYAVVDGLKYRRREDTTYQWCYDGMEAYWRVRGGAWLGSDDVAWQAWPEFRAIVAAAVWRAMREGKWHGLVRERHEGRRLTVPPWPHEMGEAERKEWAAMIDDPNSGLHEDETWVEEHDEVYEDEDEGDCDCDECVAAREEE